MSKRLGYCEGGIFGNLYYISATDAQSLTEVWVWERVIYLYDCVCVEDAKALASEWELEDFDDETLNP